MEHYDIGNIYKVDIQTFSGGVREEKPANLIDYVFIQCNDQPGQFLTCPSDNFETLMPGYLFKVDLEAEKDYKGKMLNLRLVGQDGTDRFSIPPSFFISTRSLDSFPTLAMHSRKGKLILSSAVHPNSEN